jgi:hypothetical protein
MTLRTRLDRLRREIADYEEAEKQVHPAPRILWLENDPERRRAGNDEANVAGQLMVRADDETRGDFADRLLRAAADAGELVIYVSLAGYGGTYLDDFADPDLDQRVCYEIGGPQPIRQSREKAS